MSEAGIQAVLANITVLLSASITTVGFAVIGMLCALVLGIVAASAANAKAPVLRWVVAVYVSVVRGTPLLVQLFLLFYFPSAIGLAIPAEAAALLTLILYYGAYVTEIVRAGVGSVPVGEVQAARSLGMATWQIYRRIVIPQAIARMIAPLTGQFTNLLKGTSLLSVITVSELTLAGENLSVRTQAPIETWSMVALIYIALNGIAAALGALAERRVAEWQ